MRETTFAALPVKATETFSTAPAAGAASGAAEFGLTVTTGTPFETVDRTWYEAAKTDWVATGPFSPASSSTASVIRPEPRRSATRAAISLPSPEEVTRTAAAPFSSAIWVSASTFGTTSCSANSVPSATYTVAAPYSPAVAAIDAAASPAPRTTAEGSPMRRAIVSSSRAGLRTAPSAWSTRTRISAMIRCSCVGVVPGRVR